MARIIIAFLFTFILSGCDIPIDISSGKDDDSTDCEKSYSGDSKVTMQERKDLTNKFLKEKGIPTLEHLPLVEDYTNARFRHSKEVAAKCIVLYGLIFVANGDKQSEEMINYFKRYNLWEYVSPNERLYLEIENRSESANNEMSWRIECLNVLLWSLGKFETLTFPSSLCDFSDYKDLPELDNDPWDWIKKAKLRNTEEILNELDLIYRIHWAVRDASLKSDSIPAGIDPDVVMERHFALNWLVIYAEEWDDITTDS